MTRTRARLAQPALVLSVVVASALGGCLLAEDPDPSGSGGSSAGGSPGAGGATAGAATAGTATAGAATAGTATAGAATAGTGTGGTATGGSTTGGSATGGSTTGGSTTGGSAGSGGSAMGGSGGSSPGGALSAGCGKAPTIAASMYNNGNPIAITAANKQRRYILSVPTNYDNTKPYKLVIAWHQLDGNDKQMYQQNYYWLKAIPEAASSTIFVAPNGTNSGGTPCTGNNNGEGGCGWPDAGGSNIALGDAVVAQIEANFCIDKNKIFANGWSYGGSMSYRTACSRPQGGTGTWGVRAVAVYNGAANLSSGGCTPSKSVAFYASHGTNDNVLGYDGGVSMAQTFATQNSCTWMTPTKASGNHVCTNLMGCKTGWPVEFCSFVGPHTPDPQEGGQRWQPAEVWKFFNQF
jgi:poly(3-hydroxybutyrate) depolymerase